MTLVVVLLQAPLATSLLAVPKRAGKADTKLRCTSGKRGRSSVVW